MTVPVPVPGRTVLSLLLFFGGSFSHPGQSDLAEGQNLQQVRINGTILSEDRDRPLRGAWITFTARDSVRARAVTDSVGGFSVILPSPGTYIVGVKLLGYADWTSPPFDFSDDRSLTLLLPLTPIPLEGVVAEGISKCKAPPEDLRAGSDLLSTLESVLHEIDRNSALEDYQYVMELSRPRKQWNRGTWRWLGRDTIRFRTDAVIVVEPPHVLEREGYAVAVDDSTNLYRAPGPGTISSPEFRMTHCISLVQRDTAGVIGLAFEPKAPRANLDVRGTLWIGTETGKPVPRRLEFTYVNLTHHLEERHLPWVLAWFRTRAESHREIEVREVDTERGEYGGFLVFREVSQGLPMITEWEVDQLSLGYGALWSGGKGLTIEPWVTGLPTSGRLLALLPKGGVINGIKTGEHE